MDTGRGEKKRMMEIAIHSKRKRGRPQRRWMDMAEEDVEMVRAREEDEVDGFRAVATPNREKSEEEQV